MNNDSQEVTTLEPIVWRSAITTRVERLRALLQDPKTRAYFDEDYVAKLGIKIDRLFRIILTLGAIFTAIMLSLYIAQDPRKTEFQIFAFSFKNLGLHKEVLLLIAVFIGTISAWVSAYHRYLTELRGAALEKLFPNSEIREFASHIFMDAYIDPLLKDHRDPDRHPHGLTKVLLAIFLLFLLSALVAVLGASFVLQLSVIYDVATSPSASIYVNRFVVILSVAGIGLSWLIALLQLPLPEVDSSSYRKLWELRTSQPEKYQSTLIKLVADSARLERIWASAVATAIFVSTYSFVALTLYPATLKALSVTLLFAAPGAVVACIVATSVTSMIKHRVNQAYFLKHPQGSDPDFKIFSRKNKLITAVRFALTFTASLVYSLIALPRI